MMEAEAENTRFIHTHDIQMRPLCTGWIDEARDYAVSIIGRDNGIPVIIIDTHFDSEINDKATDIPAQMKIIDSKSNPLDDGLYIGGITIRGRGNSSWHMPKRGYNIALPAEAGLLGMAPFKTWLLAANFADKSLMRNYTAYEFYRDLGAEFSPRNRFIDLIINGDYLGTYTLGERIKVGAGRIDLPKIFSDTEDEYELTGTYVLEVNTFEKINPGERVFFTDRIRGSHFVSIQQPTPRNLSEAAFEYISEYFNAAENALFSDNFKHPVNGYRAYMDTASFIDWYIVNELYKNVDAGFHTSTFFYKPRGEKLHMGPVWDFDLGAGNANYNTCDNPENWYVRNSAWYRRLFQDEEFEQEFKDRWNYLMDNKYFDVFFQRIDETAEMLARSAETNFQQWNILGRSVWPNANNPERRTTYGHEIDYLKEWLTLRMEWMDREINK
jgi:hypothetical protein